jgi:hypothetical protein
MKYPRSLKVKGKQFYKQVLSEYVFENSHHFTLLEQAAACLDRIHEAGELLERERHIIKDRFEQLKEHPAAKMERDNKILFARLLRELGLDLAKAEMSRPPTRPGGY